MQRNRNPAPDPALWRALRALAEQRGGLLCEAPSVLFSMLGTISPGAIAIEGLASSEDLSEALSDWVQARGEHVPEADLQVFRHAAGAWNVRVLRRAPQAAPLAAAAGQPSSATQANLSSAPAAPSRVTPAMAPSPPSVAFSPAELAAGEARHRRNLHLHVGHPDRDDALRLQGAMDRSMLIVVLSAVARAAGGQITASADALFEKLGPASAGDESWRPSCGLHLDRMLHELAPRNERGLLNGSSHAAAIGPGLHVESAGRGIWSLRMLPDAATRKAA